MLEKADIRAITSMGYMWFSKVAFETTWSYLFNATLETIQDVCWLSNSNLKLKFLLQFQRLDNYSILEKNSLNWKIIMLTFIWREFFFSCIHCLNKIFESAVICVKMNWLLVLLPLCAKHSLVFLWPGMTWTMSQLLVVVVLMMEARVNVVLTSCNCNCTK